MWLRVFTSCPISTSSWLKCFFHVESLIIKTKQLRTGESLSKGEGGRKVNLNTTFFIAVVHYYHQLAAASINNAIILGSCP